MNTVHCRLAIPKVEGLDDAKLTVGRHFTLKCNGEWSKDFDFSQATFSAEGLNPLQLKVFASQAVDIESFEVDATVYAPMQIPSGALSLSDSKNQILLNHDPIKIESVLENQEAEGPGGGPSAQTGPPKPHGFFIGKMEWPLFYGIAAAGVFILLVALVLLGVNRRRYWRKLELGLREYDSPLSPDSQAYRSLRLIEKQLAHSNKDIPESKLEEIQTQIYNCMCLYILRRYQVPIFQLKQSTSNRRLNAYLKSKWPRLKNQRRQIFHFMNDLQSLSKMNASERIESKQKIVKRFYEFIESSEVLFKSLQDRKRREQL